MLSSVSVTRRRYDTKRYDTRAIMVPGIQRTKPGVSPIMKSTADDILGMRLTLSDGEEDFQSVDDLKCLKQQVRILTLRAEDLEAGKKNALHNTTIWQRRVEEESRIAKERDMAIAKLLTENLKMKDSLEEVREAYAELKSAHEDLKKRNEEERQETATWHQSMGKVEKGKIDELQRQVGRLKAGNLQLSSAHLCQIEDLKGTIHNLNNELRVKEEKYRIATRTIDRLERQCEEATATNKNIELKRLISENRMQAAEMAELKQQIQRSLDSSGEIRDLKEALAVSNQRIRFLEQEKITVVESIRSELQAADDMHRQLDQVLHEMESERRVPGDQSNDHYETRIAELEAEVKALTNELASKLAMSKDVEEDKDLSHDRCLPQPGTMVDCTTLHNKMPEHPVSHLHQQESISTIETLQEALVNTEKKLNDLQESSASERRMFESKLQSWEQALELKNSQILTLETQLATRTDQARREDDDDVCPTTGPTSSDKTRDTSESSGIDEKTYESRLAEKDVAIRELHQDLAAVRNKRSEEVSELNRELGIFRTKFSEIHDDYDEQLKKKDQHIKAIEHALHGQEQVLDAMRTEMNQLQKSMQNSTTKRRGEVEELEGEILALRTQLSSREKVVTSLRMQLKESDLRHKSEVLKLRDEISGLESELPYIHTISSSENDERMTMVKERLDQLKKRNTEMKEENRSLSERLEKNIVKIQFLENVAREADDAKMQCDTLRKQVADLQEKIESSHVHGRGSSSSSWIKKAPGPESDTRASRSANRSPQKNRGITRTMTSGPPVLRFLAGGRSSSASRAVVVADDTSMEPPVVVSTGTGNSQQERRMYV